MSKELPYFRVTVQEWQNGDISDEKDATQGIFMQVCCFYWAHNCDVTLERLEKRFRNKKKHIENLINSSIIKQKYGKIHINFLDFQLENIQKEKKFYSDMGKKGYKAKKSQAPLKTNSKPPLSNKDKDKEKDKDNLEKRTQKFKSEIFHKDNGMYSIPMLTKFFEYWTEPNKSKTKMRFELEKTWDTSRRLRNWASRDKNFNKKQERSGNLPPYTPPETGELPTEDDMKEIEEIKKSKGLA